MQKPLDPTRTGRAPTIGLKVTTEFRDRVKATAEAQGLSMSEFVRFALEHQLAETA